MSDGQTNAPTFSPHSYRRPPSAVSLAHLAPLIASIELYLGKHETVIPCLDLVGYVQNELKLKYPVVF